MKYFGVVSLALLVPSVACAALSEPKSHSIEYGTIKPGDVLIHREIVMKNPKWLHFVTKEFAYPPKGQTRGRIISGVRCTDQYQNGQGGHAFLYAGGPGSKNVAVYLISNEVMDLTLLSKFLDDNFSDG